MDAGLINGRTVSSHAGHAYMAGDLTWQGHEFLAHYRSGTFWGRTKTTLKAASVTVTLESLKAIAPKLIAETLK